MVMMVLMAMAVVVHSVDILPRAGPPWRFCRSRCKVCVVGWLTTPPPEFVDASYSRCHYQKSGTTSKKGRYLGQV